MEAANQPILSGGAAGPILLVGDIRTVFLDPENIAAAGCRVFGNMLDAIDAAARTSFAAIAVVCGHTSEQLAPALKALRSARGGAKIILLTPMFDEPGAIALAAGSANGSKIVDDYLIYPTQFRRLSALIEGGGGGQSLSAEGAGGTEGGIGARLELLEKMATEDELTGLKNRRYTFEFARQIIARAGRQKKRVTILVFDIDDLKCYNDQFGHAAGDKILRQAAILMKKCCRRHDVVGRIGGDEFAVIFWDDPRRKTEGAERERRSAGDHPKEALIIAERFQKELGRPESGPLGPMGEGSLTISGGLASFPRDGSTAEELFSLADEALLEAKNSGKNRIYLVGRPEDMPDLK